MGGTFVGFRVCEYVPNIIHELQLVTHPMPFTDIYWTVDSGGDLLMVGCII